MENYILSEIMIAGRISIYELARRLRSAGVETNQEFRNALFKLINERKIFIDFNDCVSMVKK